MPFPKKAHKASSKEYHTPKSQLSNSPSLSTSTSPIQQHPASMNDPNFLSSAIYGQDASINPVYSPRHFYRREIPIRIKNPTVAGTYNFPSILTSPKEPSLLQTSSYNSGRPSEDHLKLFSSPNASYRNQFEPFKYPRQMSTHMYPNFVQTQNPPVPLFSSNQHGFENFQQNSRGSFPSYKNIRPR